MKEKPLTWNVSSLYMAAIPHTCWSRAQSQLPHKDLPSPYCPPPPFSSSHKHTIYFHTDDIDKPDSSSVGHKPAKKSPKNMGKNRVFLLPLLLIKVWDHNFWKLFSTVLKSASTSAFFTFFFYFITTFWKPFLSAYAFSIFQTGQNLCTLFLKYLDTRQR
jgi:hypothetical protein